METMRERHLRVARGVMADVTRHDDETILWASTVLGTLSSGDEAHRALDMQRLIAGEHRVIAGKPPLDLLVA